MHWSAATIEVTGSVLRAGSDTLALSEAGQVLALDERQAAQLRGPKADPAAHLLLRPYLKRAVYVGLADPSEGVPYWLVATRHPEELAAAIEHGPAADGSRATVRRPGVRGMMTPSQGSRTAVEGLLSRGAPRRRGGG